MSRKTLDPIGKLMGLRYKSHPWHGVDIGENAPQVITSFIEMVPTDTVKYEADKASGYLSIDRPQKFSSILPALYGFIPQTYCSKNVAEKSSSVLKRPDIIGDGDPLDICILTEKEITHGDILVQSVPIGGFRMIDGNEADDKIIAVMKNDAVYGEYKDITDVPKAVIDRLRHYFLTYKDMPGEKRDCEITHVYNKKEAHDVINRAVKDYRNFVENLLFS
ncbi:MAG: inorganic pyrophosphatase [Bacteroidales bacterium]|nr:inorganic pyrophosphatase [Bacteroidales bacterium]MBN2756966.1 inorganic pyrophosphatase [Bacteroidales bacterium]